MTTVTGGHEGFSRSTTLRRSDPIAFHSDDAVTAQGPAAGFQWSVDDKQLESGGAQHGARRVDELKLERRGPSDERTKPRGVVRRRELSWEFASAIRQHAGCAPAGDRRSAGEAARLSLADEPLGS